MPQVSVLMPVYNGVQTVRKALAALQAQTFPDFEIVIADDQSTDGSYEFLQEFAKQEPRIKLLRTPRNLGHGGASRLALENATGEWITMLDADDWCEPARIEAMHKAAVELKADIVIDNLQIFDHALGKIVKHTDFGASRQAVPFTAENVFCQDSPLHRHSIGYSKPMMRAEFLRKHQINYRGRYRNNEDFNLLAEIMLSGAKGYILPGAYYVYVHQISPTTRKVSPTSHSADDTTNFIAQASDEFIEKYKHAISGRLRKQILRRKNIFLTARIAGAQTQLVLEGKIGSALGLFLKHPFLWYYRALGLRNRLCRVLET